MNLIIIKNTNLYMIFHLLKSNTNLGLKYKNKKIN